MKTLKKLIFYIGKLISWVWIIAVVVICFGKQYVPFTIKGGLIVLMFISLPLIYLMWRSSVDRHAKENKKSKRHQKRLNKKQAKLNKKEKRLSKRANRKRKRHEKNLNKKQTVLNKFKKRTGKKVNKVSTQSHVEPVVVNTTMRLEAMEVNNPEIKLEQSEVIALTATQEIEPDSTTQHIEDKEVPVEQPKIKWLPKEPLKMEDKWVYEFEKVTKLNPVAYVVLDERFVSIRHQSIEGVLPELLHGQTQIPYADIEKVELQVSSFPSMGTIQFILKGEHQHVEGAQSLSFTEDYLELGTEVVKQIESKLETALIEVEFNSEQIDESHILRQETEALEADSSVLIDEQDLNGEQNEEVAPGAKNDYQDTITENKVNQPNRLTEDVVQQLKAYKELLDLEIITKEEFEQKKAEFLS